MRVILREMTVGLLNGVGLRRDHGRLAAFWFGSRNSAPSSAWRWSSTCCSPALAGILIPLSLDKVGIDPAVASSVFVTTVTDVVGFFAFLGLAAWWFNIF